MKALKAIERLTKNYKPDDEILIAWWDTDLIAPELKITKAEWKKICELLSDLTPSANEEIYETALYELVQLREGDN